MEKIYKTYFLHGHRIDIFNRPKKKDSKYTALIYQKYHKSFGNVNYQHYYDKIGKYSNLDHLDPKRLKLYDIRHKSDI